MAVVDLTTRSIVDFHPEAAGWKRHQVKEVGLLILNLWQNQMQHLPLRLSQQWVRLAADLDFLTEQLLALGLGLADQLCLLAYPFHSQLPRTAALLLHLAL